MSAGTFYSGKSDGMKATTEGFIEYAQEVIMNRAIPDIRDGLKTVQRRILHSALEHKTLMKGGQVGSFELVSDANKYHPHGDSSIYDAMTRIVDSSEYINNAVLIGDGNFSKAYSTDSAAASRYTGVMVSPSIRDFRTCPDSEEQKVSEKGGFEPAALTVNYPNILVMGGSGMAVSVATEIPSFNFWDVLGLLEKYVTRGSLGIDDMIAPDYPSGGHYIMNREELAKTMLSGKGRIVVRSDVEIVGRDICVKDLPPEMTMQRAKLAIEKKIKDKVYPGIVSVERADGYESDYKLVITCRSAAVTEQSLLALYRDNILQSKTRANTLTVDGEGPVFGGVYKIIEHWTQWRLGIIKRQLEIDLKSFTEEREDLSYFVRLIENPEWKQAYLHAITEVSRAKADAYLHEIFEDIPAESVKWIGERRASSFLNGGKYKDRYVQLGTEIASLETRLGDLPQEILNDIESLRVSHKGEHERKTEITYTDYIFSQRKAESAEDRKVKAAQAAIPVWFNITDDGFLTVTTNKIVTEGSPGVLRSFQGTSSDVLIGFDNIGRIIRFYAGDEPTPTTSGKGIYLPRYFGVEEVKDENFEYKILYMTRLQGQEIMLLFKDGYASFIDTSKWLDTKANYKIVNKGVNLSVSEDLLDVIEGDDIPKHIVLADSGRDVYRFGQVNVDEIDKPAGSSGRRRIVTGTNINIDYWTAVDEEMSEKWLKVADEDKHKWVGRIKAIPQNNMRKYIDEGLAFTDPTFTS